MNTSHRSPVRVRWLVVLAAMAITAAVLIAADPAALCLLPALALAAPLLMRRYPGERTIVLLSGARPRSRRTHPRSSGSRVRLASVVLLVVRGGRLIGCSLAVRPPPALHSAS
jgi:hypothetical protein